MKNCIKICLTILVVAAVSIGAYFILRACGVTDVESLRELIASCGAWGWIVFITLFTLCTSLLCFIPASSMTFIIVSVVLFGAIKGFIISSISVFLSSSLMFILGNTLGEKVAVKLVGKESLEKAQNLVDVKSKMLLPLMFLFPVFPDDALCLVAGMTKMRYWYFAVIVGIFRTIGVATTCFLGSGLINWAVLSLVDWFVLISVCLFWILLIFKYQHNIEKFITKKKIDRNNNTLVSITNNEKDVPRPKEKKSIKMSREESLWLKIKELNNVIMKKQRKLDLHLYGSETEKLNIESKILNIKKEKEKVEEKFLREFPHSAHIEGVVQFDDDRIKLQDITCAEIEKIMKNEFANVKYRIKRSITTPSIYLILINNSGVEKTIRFSNHKSPTMNKSYPIETIMSNKEIKKIIARNIKVLDRKAVYVLIDKLQEEKEKK